MLPTTVLGESLLDSVASLTVGLATLILLAGLSITLIDLLNDLTILVNNVINYGTDLYRSILSFNDTYNIGTPPHNPSLEMRINNLTNRYCEYLSDSISIIKTATLGTENEIIEQLVREAEKLSCNLTSTNS